MPAKKKAAAKAPEKAAEAAPKKKAPAIKTVLRGREAATRTVRRG